MKSSEEFKAEVYLRAHKRKLEIKRRRRVLAAVLPCAAVAVIGVIAAIPGILGTAEISGAPGNPEIVDVTKKAEEHAHETQTLEQDYAMPGAAQETSDYAQSTLDGQRPAGAASAQTGSFNAAVLLRVATQSISLDCEPTLLYTQGEFEALLAQKPGGAESEIYKSLDPRTFNGGFFSQNALAVAVLGDPQERASYEFVSAETSADGVTLIFRRNESGDGEGAVWLAACPLDKGQTQPGARVTVRIVE